MSDFRIYEIAYTFPGGYGGRDGHYDIKVEARSPGGGHGADTARRDSGPVRHGIVESLPVPEDEDAAEPAPEEIAAVSPIEMGTAGKEDERCRLSGQATA